MKNRIFISSILVAIGLLSSCSDSFLQEDYSDPILISYDENTIKTNQDLQKFIKGLYSRFGTSSFSGDYFTYQELTGDLGFVSIKNSGYFVNTNAENHLVVDGGASSGIWSSFYTTISNANLILAFEGKVPDDPKGGVKSKSLFAHAKVIRAYNYLALLGLFSPNYGEGDQSLGVPYPTIYNIEAKLPRETVPNVVNNIIADLTSSLADFEADKTASSIYGNNNSFNVDAVKLLLARTYLYKKDYVKAIEYANEIINLGGELVGGTGNTGSNLAFGTIFTLLGENNPEILFQIEENNIIPSNNNLQPYWGISGAYKQNFMAQDFFNSFMPNPLSPNANTATDVRVRNNAWYQNNATTYPDSPAPINVKKYLNGPRDVILLRKTEAFFIKAEAQYHSSPATAFETLKSWVVTHRDPGYNKNLTGTAVLDEILRQKGFEFFLEGMRFTDMKRNNKAIVKVQKANNVPLGEIPVGDRRFIWPIPLSEIQTNPNIKQAPNY